MSRDMVYEDVPPVSRRQGDNLVAGQNNSTILLGRDRMGSVDSGYGSGKGAGAMHLVVGRKSQDPSVIDDAATVYLSAKSDPDAQAGTDSVQGSKKSMSTAIMRADCVRIVPREDMKISVGKAYLFMSSDGKVIIEGDIQLGEGAADRIIRGDAFSEFWNTVVVPTPVGPSGPPPPIPPPVFSARSKVK